MITKEELLKNGFKEDKSDPQFKYWKETKFDYDQGLLDPPVLVYDVVRNRFALYNGGDMFIYTDHFSIDAVLEWVSRINDVEIV